MHLKKKNLQLKHLFELVTWLGHHIVYIKVQKRQHYQWYMMFLYDMYQHNKHSIESHSILSPLTNTILAVLKPSHMQSSKLYKFQNQILIFQKATKWMLWFKCTSFTHQTNGWILLKEIVKCTKATPFNVCGITLGYW